ncbi:glycosyl hydrolase [Acidaminobacter sp. JC074]|uniref:glycoside hydrolase family 3 C-terminal domain-containing protein n=1 Tax=Acidaminobacter sp. JC074 TaxID=2530199 RepID=UPI001F115E6E|nr:glycoside hydrolase family 3 C-terminal domain-containing protein [Acidaminobacter sp. JC074]MCH4890133.1 glycosyl hydrolase [Acidaminobacter sp. JC074]
MNTEYYLRQMSLEEKAKFCQGKDTWRTMDLERLGLKFCLMSDGPHGLRKQEGASDHLGINKSVEATCFPAACLTACSFDEDLIYEMGQALGKECVHADVSVLLGPGVNIKRSPLCGRNFEYFSEDPYLTGKLAASYIKGVQSNGVGTSLKHFAANNREYYRMIADSLVDERALREIYLPAFEICVKEAKPWTVMSAYNKLNGLYASENKRLLTDILKDEWGYDGCVVTDWGGVNNRVLGIKAGCHLEMPYIDERNTKKIISDVKTNKLSMEDLDRAVSKVIELNLKSFNVSKGDLNKDKHHELANRIVGESAVLLKNDGLLPIKEGMKIGLIGSFAEKPRYQGAGSSLVNPYRLDTIKSVLEKDKNFIGYAEGYERYTSDVNPKLVDQAVELSKKSDVIILVAGLTESYESEGYDREDLCLPKNHNHLIKEVSKYADVIVILQNGSVVDIPWLSDVKGLLEVYLQGQAGSKAVYDILKGKINPSGKLAETFPYKLEDNPSFPYYSSYEKSCEYRESIYVGYRYYDKANVKPLFPFGYGLSYSEFEYSNLMITALDDYDFEVSLQVKNIGDYPGKEVVQLYVHSNDSKVFKEVKSLKGFKKVHLEPGHTKEVRFTLNKRSFAYYNTIIKDWHVDGGRYKVAIGASSRDLRLSDYITFENDHVNVDQKDSLAAYNEMKEPIDEKSFLELYGKPLSKDVQSNVFDLSSSLHDIRHTFLGKKILSHADRREKSCSITLDGIDSDQKPSTVGQTPIKVLPMFSKMSGKKLSPYFIDGLVSISNKRYLKGIYYMLKR